MSSYNDITGAKQATKGATDKYRDGWDRIFGKKEESKPEPKVVQVELPTEYFDKARIEADALRRQWWEYIEKNQKTLTSIPTFAEWHASQSQS